MKGFSTNLFRSRHLRYNNTVSTHGPASELRILCLALELMRRNVTTPAEKPYGRLTNTLLSLGTNWKEQNKPGSRSCAVENKSFAGGYNP